jgi:hypothetical protein
MASMSGVVLAVNGLIPSISIGTKRYVAETEIDRLFIPAQKEG